MTSAQLTITLDKVKKLLEEGADKDDLLSIYIDKAEQFIVSNCNLNQLATDEDLPPGLLNVLKDIVVIAWNRRGVEGTQSRTEGSISNTFYVLGDDLPKSIKSVLSRYRKLRW